jgi:hypothetical protein
MINRRQDPTPATSGEASGKHQGLRQPADDGRVENAVDKIGLDDRGERMEDQLRDRHSKGVADAFDDSVDRDAARQFVEDEAIDPEAPRH